MAEFMKNPGQKIPSIHLRGNIGQKVHPVDGIFGSLSA
jgi:hypothetical protein